MTACQKSRRRAGADRRRRQVDASGKTVTLGDGSKLPYDRLVLSPGIDINWGALPGYDEAGGREDAACLEGRRADRAAAPASCRRWTTAAWW
jgi:NADPH-dependent 2,4-dienoyl-CoA reductase/sulfur reductase-like enzyme